MTHVLTTFIDEWSLAKVKEMAERDDRSISWVIGFAVKQFFVSRGGQVTMLEPGAHGRQVDLEEAIATVKRVPSKSAKHK